MFGAFLPEVDITAAEELYRGLVMERARRPLHAGDVETLGAVGGGTNPLCGDTVRIGVRRDAAGRLADVRHSTQGCAICAAASDLVAESVVGLDDAAVQALWRRFDALLRNGTGAVAGIDRDALGLLNAFADLHDYRSRRKCATLPWSALLAALESGGGS